jgi:hypothetical protein
VAFTINGRRNSDATGPGTGEVGTIELVESAMSSCFLDFAAKELP